MIIKDKNLEMYCGDCLEIMPTIPDGSIDMVLTDPPYGMAYQSSRRTDKYRKIKNDTNLNWLPDLLGQCYRVLKDDTACFFFCSWHHLDTFIREIKNVFRLKNVLVWDKGAHTSGDLSGNFGTRTEFIIFCTKGRPLLQSKRPHNILRYGRTRNELHPTQKPVDLLGFLIRQFLPSGSIVLDPYSGSGSTGVACANSKARYLGVEVDVDYYSNSVRRVWEAYA